MKYRQLLIAGAMLGLGSAQAWDSEVLSATPLVAIIVALGVLAPALSLFSGQGWVRVAALLLSAAAMTFARLVSPVSHNGLHLVTFIAVLLMMLEHRSTAARSN
jgi:hypothetical protein